MALETLEDDSADRITHKVKVDGLLLDMDGTLIDSTSVVVRHWHAIGEELGLDADVILETSHGRRSIDVLRVLAPEKANWEYVKRMESLLPLQYGHDTVEIPGARNLLASLTSSSSSSSTVPWAIVTSGTTPLVTGWLDVLSLPHPPQLVAAEDVEHGKPDPSCYLLGKERLGLGNESVVLVFEDSPAGIKAGRDAGCRVVGLCTTHSEREIREAGAEWVLKDLRAVKIVNEREGWMVEMTGVL